MGSSTEIAHGESTSRSGRSLSSCQAPVMPSPNSQRPVFDCWLSRIRHVSGMVFSGPGQLADLRSVSLPCEVALDLAHAAQLISKTCSNGADITGRCNKTLAISSWTMIIDSGNRFNGNATGDISSCMVSYTISKQVKFAELSCLPPACRFAERQRAFAMAVRLSFSRTACGNKVEPGSFRGKVYEVHRIFPLQKYRRSTASNLVVISCTTLSDTGRGVFSAFHASLHPLRASVARASTIVNATVRTHGCVRHCKSDTTARQSPSCPSDLLIAQSTSMSFSSCRRTIKTETACWSWRSPSMMAAISRVSGTG